MSDLGPLSGVVRSIFSGGARTSVFRGPSITARGSAITYDFADAYKGYCDDIRILPVPIDLLALLVALLSFHRQRSDWTGFQPLQRNRLASLLAITVGVVLDAL